ncbi:Hypothetical predicted protein [Mytilus galloprovincialis]|uniref:Uncharacterized protein n=1 Tax=Mytilus galloprovincialis TaxID=29158 RepID=A0A8B6H8X9_MYTGA|nr:Hypothetical predicted protein [Mytilus galloprovincialis]
MGIHLTNIEIYVSECEAGYTSSDGTQCEPCSDQSSYGIKCLSTCQCTNNQRCHHVVGCINVSSTTFQMTKEGYSTSASMKTINYDREEKTDYKQDTAWFDQKIVVYTTCIAGLLIVITICYVCVKHLNNRTTNGLNENNNMNRKHEHNRLIDNRHELPIPVVSNRGNARPNEFWYDEIDEINIDETKASFEKHCKSNNESSSETSASENDVKLESDGYQNPYQQIVKDPYSHDYKTAVVDETKTMENQLQNMQEMGYVDAMSTKIPTKRKDLDITDGPHLTSLKSTEIINPTQDVQLDPQNQRQYSVVVNIQNRKKTSISMLQLSGEKNTFKQKPELLSLNKRLSI